MKSRVSPQMLWVSLGHMWTHRLTPAENPNWNICETRLWLQLAKCQLGACNFCRIMSSKHDVLVKNTGILWKYFVSMRINNRCCKDTFSWKISWWSSLSSSISLLFQLHRVTESDYSELEGTCKDWVPSLKWTWPFKKRFVWDTQSQLVSLFF